MCGRYTRKPRFNIAPGQIVEAIRLANGQQSLFTPKWGIPVSWMPEPLKNAKAETIATKKSFRQAFQERRCILPADGFYEWLKTGGKKQPYFITLTTGQPFGFAGIWELPKAEGEPETVAIVTTAANEIVAPIHTRMPVFLQPEDFGTWLDPASSAERLAELMRPFPADKLTAWPVSPRVNTARDNDARLIERVELPPPTTLF